MILSRRPIRSWSEPIPMTAFSSNSAMRPIALSRLRQAIEDIHYLICVNLPDAANLQFDRHNASIGVPGGGQPGGLEAGDLRIFLQMIRKRSRTELSARSSGASEPGS